MAKLPAAYLDLAGEPGPRLLTAALATYGTKEWPGAANNPTILSWAAETGLAGVYRHDSIAWCGLWMAVVCVRASWEPIKDPLWARNWTRWQRPSDRPSLGDVLVFERAGGGGHVGMYVGEDGAAFHVLGGNQSDQVNIMRIARTRLLAARRPDWRVAQPANVRPIKRRAAGVISQNEA
jgi:uncharacterized protein (TIGR02594 family)